MSTLKEMPRAVESQILDILATAEKAGIESLNARSIAGRLSVRGIGIAEGTLSVYLSRMSKEERISKEGKFPRPFYYSLPNKPDKYAEVSRNYTGAAR